MKNLFIICVTFLLVAACTTDKGSCVIKGTVPVEYNDQWIYLYDYNQAKNIDSVLLADGQFSFSRTPDIIHLMRIKLIIESEGRELYSNVILESGTINVNLSNAMEVNGTPLNDEFIRYRKEVNDLSKSADEEYGKLAEMYKDDEEALTKAGDALRDSIFSTYKTLNNTFFHANKDNAIAAYILQDWAYELSADEFDVLYNELDENVRNQSIIQKIKEMNEKKTQTAEGKMFTDFTIENGNPDGSAVAFSDYIGKGKYILVDFWASWCGPCLAETPVIAEVYKKHKGNKFDVLGVAVWDKRDATLKAIKEHNIVWPQIIDAQQIPTTLYGIDGIPQIILFGPDGTIIARNLRGDALKAKVDEVMK